MVYKQITKKQKSQSTLQIFLVKIVPCTILNKNIQTQKNIKLY